MANEISRLIEARRMMLERGMRPSRWRFSPVFWGKALAAHSSENMLVRVDPREGTIKTVLGLPFAVINDLKQDFELLQRSTSSLPLAYSTETRLIWSVCAGVAGPLPVAIATASDLTS